MTQRVTKESKKESIMKWLEKINQMDKSDLIEKKEHLERYFDKCREIGQGINTKEFSQYYLVCNRLEELGQKIKRWQ